MQQARRRRYEYSIASSVAEVLGLTNFFVDMKLRETDLDIAGYNSYTNEVHIAEIKSKLTQHNVQHAINQLCFREKLANRVWLVVPQKYVYYALALVPNRYGIISYRSGKVFIWRESKKFTGVYRTLVLIKVLGKQL